jgi:pSer/pThr/pTyr-binding forkhead associated (FHA) protein
VDQAKHYICRSCLTSVPRGHKFCGRCGEPVPETVTDFSTQYWSDMQDPTKARLILVHGQGMDGLSYHLKADQHVVGRNGQLEFPDDVFVSPTHANFFYRNNKLVVRDEGSLNGVYLRVRGTAAIAPGDTFMAGNHVFRLDLTPKATDTADGDGTAFYSSPKQATTFRVSEILSGGSPGITVCATGTRLQIGRENCDLNFPSDAQMDASHCSIDEQGGSYVLNDHDTKNGTYVRIKSEIELGHGDYLFVGRKLLRVELNA